MVTYDMNFSENFARFDFIIGYTKFRANFKLILVQFNNLFIFYQMHTVLDENRFL